MMPLALFASSSFIGVTVLTFLLYGALGLCSSSFLTYSFRLRVIPPPQPAPHCSRSRSWWR